MVFLLAALVQAPFHHTHESDPHHEHAEGLIHAHPHGQAEAPAGPGWESPDHDIDARFKDWFSFEGKPHVRLIATLQTIAAPAKPALCVCDSITDLTPRSHDPPWAHSLQSRAPPA